MNFNFVEFTKQAKALLSKIKWSQEQLVNGMLIEYDGDSISKSSIIYAVSPDGEKSLLPDGEYKTKSGTLFILTDGKVSSVQYISNSSTTSNSDQPVKQAQSVQVDDDKSNTQMNKSPEKAEELASDVAAPADSTTSTDDSAEDTSSLQSVLQEALAPIAAALQQILQSIGSTTEMAKETKTELSKVKDTVAKLADEPAPEKKVEKEVKNPFASAPKDIKESRTYQILNSTQKS